MSSYPYYISWDNIRGLILHLAASCIILSCSTCQTSLKLSPASWPIHPALYFLAPDIWRVDTLLLDLKFSFPLSPSNACPWLKGKDIGYMIIPSLNSQFSGTFHFLLQKMIRCSAGDGLCAAAWTSHYVPRLNSLILSLCPPCHQYADYSSSFPQYSQLLFIISISYHWSLLCMHSHTLKLLIYAIWHLPTSNGGRKKTDKTIVGFRSKIDNYISTKRLLIPKVVVIKWLKNKNENNPYPWKSS